MARKSGMSNELVKALAALGVDVNKTTRIVLDMRADGSVVLHVESFPDEAGILGVFQALHVEDVQIERGDSNL